VTLFLSKLTVLFLLGAGAAALLCERAAAVRHLVRALTLAGAAALAIVAFVGPEMPVVMWERTVQQAPHGAAAAAAVERVLEAPGPRPPDSPRRRPSMPGIGVFYMLGVAAVLTRLIAGRMTVARIVSASDAARPIGNGVRVVTSAAVTAPFTAGSIILLPASAATWPEDRRRAALMHELAHIERRDDLVLSLATLACALYWFHPLAWLALRALRREGELATDDLVIARGMPAPDYATHLFEIARGRGAAGLLALGMACPSDFETRLRALLDRTRKRGAIPRVGAWLAIGGAALFIVPLAAARPEVRVRPANETGGAGTRAIASPAFERSLDAAPGGTLVLDLNTGAGLEIIGHDAARVDIRGTLGGPDAYRSIVEATKRGNEIRLTSRLAPGPRSSSTSHTFVIDVPRRFNVTLKSAGGSLTIDDVSGIFTGTTGGGTITLRRLHGRADLATGGGDVRVTDSRLDGSVTTGAGRVSVSRVEGVFGAATGSDDSPVADREADEPDGPRDADVGPIRIHKAGGDVDLDGAPNGALISTGGGRITVGAARGFVKAGTGGGDISVGPIAGSVRASTGAGRVDITLADAGGEAQRVEVVNGSGPVRLTLPASFDGRLEIETAYTASNGPVRIDGDWALEREPVTGWDAHEGTPRRYVRASGSAGRGRDLVRIRTVNGDVTLLRR